MKEKTMKLKMKCIEKAKPEVGRIISTKSKYRIASTFYSFKAVKALG